MNHTIRVHLHRCTYFNLNSEASMHYKSRLMPFTIQTGRHYTLPVGGQSFKHMDERINQSVKDAPLAQ